MSDEQPHINDSILKLMMTVDNRIILKHRDKVSRKLQKCGMVRPQYH